MANSGRIDNTTHRVLVYYDLEIDPLDPGMTNPIDLCSFCLLGWHPELLIDHPDYQDDNTCFECDSKLMEPNNEC